MQNQLSDQEIESIQRVKLFSVIEYLEQQIEFIAKNYKDVYAAYQQSKISQPKIVKYEQGPA